MCVVKLGKEHKGPVVAWKLFSRSSERMVCSEDQNSSFEIVSRRKGSYPFAGGDYGL